MGQLFDERLTTVQIYYYMPDHCHLLQEFLWQTVDHNPDFPRIHKFLDHWKNHVEARIQSVYLSHADYWGGVRRINFTHKYMS